LYNLRIAENEDVRANSKWTACFVSPVAFSANMWLDLIIICVNIVFFLAVLICHYPRVRSEFVDLKALEYLARRSFVCGSDCFSVSSSRDVRTKFVLGGFHHRLAVH